MSERVTLHRHPKHKAIFLTEDGRVFRELPSVASHGGYHLINIGTMRIRRHTLVLETFKGKRPSPKHGARHLNGNPQDDRPANLTWGTQKENCQDTVRHGRSTRGVRNSGHKLTEQAALDIKRRLAAGESGRSIAKDHGISEQQISTIKYGRSWSWLKP